MPRKLVDADGNEVEVPTEEELQQMREKADKAEELKEKAEKAEELQEELEGLSDVRNLRKKTESYEKALKERGLYYDKESNQVKEKDTDKAIDNDRIQEMVKEQASKMVDEKLKSKEKEDLQKSIEDKIDKAAGGDEKIKETLKKKWELYSEGRELTSEVANELISDITTSVLGSRKNRVREMAGMGGGLRGGGGNSLYEVDEDQTKERKELALNRLEALNYKSNLSREELKEKARLRRREK